MSKEHGAYVTGAFWTLSPVVAITSAWDGKVNGQIAVTVVNGSLVHSHPRLIVGIWKKNYTHDFILNSRSMVIHLLRNDQMSTVKNFGFYTGRDRDKFVGVATKTGTVGCPILLDAHSYAECKVINKMDCGDMTSFLVDVVDGGIINSGEWLTLQHFYSNAPMEWIQQYQGRMEESIEESLRTINNIDYSAWTP